MSRLSIHPQAGLQIRRHAHRTAAAGSAPGRTLALVTASSILLVTGCGGESKVPVFPVSGNVSFQGKPPVGARVVLQNTKPEESPGVAPTGTVQDDGSFVITSYESGDGAPAGEYVALIQWFKMAADKSGAGPNVIPRKYSDPNTSPFKLTVSNGPTQAPPFAIGND